MVLSYIWTVCFLIVTPLVTYSPFHFAFLLFLKKINALCYYISVCSADGTHRPSSRHSLLDCVQNPTCKSGIHSLRQFVLKTRQA